MFEFVKSSGYIPITDDEIDFLNSEFNIRIPQILRKYYIMHNGKYMHNVYINFEDKIRCLHYIIPLTNNNASFNVEDILNDEIHKSLVSDKLIPFGIDEGGAIFYWDKESYKVYICLDSYMDDNDDMEIPIYVCDSIECFFKYAQDSYLNSIS